MTTPQDPTPPAAPVTPDPTPAPVAQTPPTPPAPPADNSAAEYERVKREYEEYRAKVDPVLETIWSDTELLDKTQAIHNKRLGIATPDPTPAPGTPAPVDSDTRSAMVNTIHNDFEKELGIDKMTPEKQQEVRGMVGTMVKEMLDPRNNKTISQVYEEVSLTKLPWYLRRAFDLVNKSSEIEQAKEAGRNEVLAQYSGEQGMIGSISGGSVPIDQVTLTQKEKEIALKQGVSEENYLKQKKEILQYRSS